MAKKKSKPRSKTPAHVTFKEPSEPPKRHWRTWLVGRPLPSAALQEESIGKLVGLAIFASDALSSTAYATQEILVILIAAGAAAMTLSLPISMAIVALLLIVAFSYRQTIFAYPQGGGAYTVTQENLGEVPAQAAGAALMTDYVLTVAVSVSAGVAQIVSAFPGLDSSRVLVAIFLVALVSFINLRGARESGAIFAVPTYFFLAMMLFTVGMGFARYFSGNLGAVSGPPEIELVATGSLGLFLILRAFANGTTALTGIEAISNGITAFKVPRSHNAAATLTWMVGLLSALFLSITFLSLQVQAIPSEAETVISQLTRTVFSGRGGLYLAAISSTTVILVMAANTAFAGFPRLSALIANDGYLPRQLNYIGSRLVYSRGIALLAVASSALIVLFNARVTALIPLYAVGVFLSFTLSQFGMARHWLRAGRPNSGVEADPHWRPKILVNAVGGIATLIVMVVFAITKFLDGAWIVAIVIPSLMVLFSVVKAHYRHLADELSTATYKPHPDVKKHKVILPVSGVHKGTIEALRLARSISKDITAVHVSVDAEAAEKLLLKWQQWAKGIDLVIIGSPYRVLLPSLVTYIQEAAENSAPDESITVVVPEFIPRHRWHNLLHMQTAETLRHELLNTPGVIILEVPYQVD
ncbi:MAG: APC family permease [Chloroflexi bacterium]|nr:APC family permease [Chloroflexota bacterium]MQC26824.1 APC family permease [Chloroflexota bacterium]